MKHPTRHTESGLAMLYVLGALILSAFIAMSLAKLAHTDKMGGALYSTAESARLAVDAGQAAAIAYLKSDATKAAALAKLKKWHGDPNPLDNGATANDVLPADRYCQATTAQQTAGDYKFTNTIIGFDKTPNNMVISILTEAVGKGGSRASGVFSYKLNLAPGTAPSVIPSNAIQMDNGAFEFNVNRLTVNGGTSVKDSIGFNVNDSAAFNGIFRLDSTAGGVKKITIGGGTKGAYFNGKTYIAGEFTWNGMGIKFLRSSGFGGKATMDSVRVKYGDISNSATAWAAGRWYSICDIVSHAGQLYESRTANKSLAAYPPNYLGEDNFNTSVKWKNVWVPVAGTDSFYFASGLSGGDSKKQSLIGNYLEAYDRSGYAYNVGGGLTGINCFINQSSSSPTSLLSGTIDIPSKLNMGARDPEIKFDTSKLTTIHVDRAASSFSSSGRINGDTLNAWYTANSANLLGGKFLVVRITGTNGAGGIFTNTGNPFTGKAIIWLRNGNVLVTSGFPNTTTSANLSVYIQTASDNSGILNNVSYLRGMIYVDTFSTTTSNFPIVPANDGTFVGSIYAGPRAKLAMNKAYSGNITITYDYDVVSELGSIGVFTTTGSTPTGLQWNGAPNPTLLTRVY